MYIVYTGCFSKCKQLFRYRKNNNEIFRLDVDSLS